MKVCFKCGAEKPLSEFYKHPKMADGHVNKCKVCNKKDVIENRLVKLDYYRAYDTTRGNRQSAEYIRQYRSTYPKKYAAHAEVSNAVKDGRIVPKTTCDCGATKVVAHHDDYDYPLQVRWLCQGCHVQWHKQNGEGLNG